MTDERTKEITTPNNSRVGYIYEKGQKKDLVSRMGDLFTDDYVLCFVGDGITVQYNRHSSLTEETYGGPELDIRPFDESRITYYFRKGGGRRESKRHFLNADSTHTSLLLVNPIGRKTIYNIYWDGD